MRIPASATLLGLVAGCSLLVDSKGNATDATDASEDVADASACSQDGVRACIADSVHECTDGAFAQVEACPFGCSENGGAHCAAFVPANLPDDTDFDPDAPILLVGVADTATINTTTGAIAINGASLPNVPSRVVLEDGADQPLEFPLRVFSFSAIEVRGQVSVVGSNLPVLVSTGDVTVSGAIAVAGFGRVCADGTPDSGENTGCCGESSGGGGGGFAAAGGDGGADCPSCQFAAETTPGGAGLADPDSVTLVPLVPGCDGSRGGFGGTPSDPNCSLAGPGGGALQIAALGTIQVAAGGSLCVGGGGGFSGSEFTCGTTGCSSGGGGGGSGGALLLEALAVEVEPGGLLNTSGGSGAPGGAAQMSIVGASGCQRTAPSSCSAGAGAFGTDGAATGCPGIERSTGGPGAGGGGGGGIGIIRIHAKGPISVPEGAWSGSRLDGTL